MLFSFSLSSDANLLAINKCQLQRIDTQISVAHSHEWVIQSIKANQREIIRSQLNAMSIEPIGNGEEIVISISHLQSQDELSPQHLNEVQM